VADDEATIYVLLLAADRKSIFYLKVSTNYMEGLVWTPSTSCLFPFEFLGQICIVSLGKVIV